MEIFFVCKYFLNCQRKCKKLPSFLFMCYVECHFASGIKLCLVLLTQWAKSLKKQSEGVRLLFNSALIIQWCIVKNTLLQTAFSTIFMNFIYFQLYMNSIYRGVNHSKKCKK